MSTATKRRTHTKTGGGRSSSTPLVVGAIVFVVVAALLALFLSGGDEPGVSEDTQYSAVTITGDALPAPGGASADADPAVGTTAPKLEGTNFQSAPVTVPSEGRPTLVVFAAHWCPHCQVEVPRLVEWMEAGNGTDVDVVAVSTAADPKAPNWPPQEWLERERWDRPVLVDDSEGSANAAYGVDGYPFFTLVDADGKVVWRGSGEIEMDALDAVLAERL